MARFDKITTITRQPLRPQRLRLHRLLQRVLFADATADDYALAGDQAKVEYLEAEGNKLPGLERRALLRRLRRLLRAARRRLVQVLRRRQPAHARHAQSQRRVRVRVERDCDEGQGRDILMTMAMAISF